MSESAKKLYYRKSGATGSAKLYTTTDEVGADRLGIRSNGSTIYAKLGATNDPDATPIRVRKSGATKAVLSQAALGIVTNGLILHLDMGNPSSYPGSGSTWYDISGSGYNVTLSGQSYVNTNGGVLSINQAAYVVPINLTTSPFTVMYAGRYLATGYRGRVVGCRNNCDWLLGHWQNSTENYVAGAWISPQSQGANDNNWRTYAGTGNQTNLWQLFVNGTLKSGPNNNGLKGPDGLSSAATCSPGESSNAYLGFILAYNRVLSSAEVLQNHNVFKGRYGL